MGSGEAREGATTERGGAEEEEEGGDDGEHEFLAGFKRCRRERRAEDEGVGNRQRLICAALIGVQS